jgi:hypothetical protein
MVADWTSKSKVDEASIEVILHITRGGNESDSFQAALVKI